MSEKINPLRSFLFVPGNRPERFEKARDSGADIYCIDLEDAVAPADKKAARSTALAYLSQRKRTSAACYLRINSLATSYGLEDLLALSELAKHGSLPDCIVLPMATSAFEIRQIIALLNANSPLNIMPMIETPAGIDGLPQILDEGRGYIQTVAFGFADYVAITGSDMSWDALLVARSAIVKAASVHAVHCFDGPFFDIPDLTGLAAEALAVSRLGFRGKMAIHPSQVDTINNVFTPSEERVLWAQKIVSAFERSGGGVLSVDGKMVDQPVFEQARRVLSASINKGENQ